MKFRQPFDTILGHPAKVRILRFFCRKGGEWSGNRIASQIGSHPMTAHKALRELHQATLLDLRRIGNSLVYSLRDRHFLVREILRPLFEGEAKLQDRLSALLGQALKEGQKAKIITVAIYGSVARGEERPTSDIDLLVLVETEQTKRQIQDALDRFCENVMEEFGNIPSLYVNTLAEARQKVQRKLPLLQNILRDHRVIWGKPLKGVLHAKAA